MANKPLDIHPSALAEVKAAVLWYQQRNQRAALKFVAELDRAIELILASRNAGQPVSTRHGSLF